MRVIVFGSLNADTTLDVDRQPAWGETILARGWSTAAGGKGANQAVAAARAGAPHVAMVGRVGADAAGSFLQAELEASGVEAHVTVDPSRATGGAYILRGPDGTNAIVVAPGANDAVELDDLARIDTSDDRTFLILQLEVPVSVVAESVALARARGWSVVLNAAPVRAGAADLVAGCDTLVANELEAAQLTGLSVGDVAQAVTAGEALRRRGPARVAVTLGAHGAVLVTDGVAWYAPAPEVDVVDTTAAGDAFVAGLAVALAQGLPDDRALAIAVAAGSLTTTRAGAQPSLPRHDEILHTATTVNVARIGTSPALSEGVPM